MNKFFVLAIISSILIFSYVEASAQEPQLATFQETAQIIIDKSISNNVTAAIALQSTNNQEIRIPEELSNKIQDTERVMAVIITSEEQCVLGVQNESCIMINLSREGIEGGIFAIQDMGRLIGDSLIADINSVFDTDAQFHSVFLHQADESGIALETSGVISGRGTVSAVYTMPREDSKTMYEKFSTILLPKEIRESGGFYDIAKKISVEPESRITLSIIPQNGISLNQLKLSLDYPNSADEIESISPLEFLKSDNLIRSDYFSNDFYPLNSLLKVVLLSKEPVKVDEINTKIVPDIIKDGERFPEFTTDGWFFDQPSGQKIEATYLFGKKSSIGKNELVFTIGPIDGSNDNVANTKSNTNEIDSFQIVILVGIIMAAAGASIYYLKGFRGK
ncbi:MAG TPA: hypothetical protein VLA01_01220 [Nitrosopumilaceae archaeon]|nr:hypothetical protein [Nitrosopumilaceae archaeon]